MELFRLDIFMTSCVCRRGSLRPRRDRTDDLAAALFLHEDEERRRAQIIEEKTSAEQFIAAAEAPPSKFKSRLHFARFQGPTARKDSEESERQRWILANLIISTDTPMVRLLQARQGDIAVLGAGRGAGTMRSRVRNLRHLLAWLAVNYGITYPTDQTHLTEFLQVHLSEPCNHGSLKITHESFVFLDIVSGVESQHRLTSSQLCISIHRKLLSRALPGKATKQAPWMFTAMLRGLELMIMSNTSPLYFRIYAWWICVQSWATLRCDDHRGLNPKDV